ALTVNANQINHLKLAIADNGEATIDSVLLIGGAGAVANNGAPINGLATGTISTYHPLRYIYNPDTTTYDGNITVVNRYANDLVGPNFIVLSNLPPGVTVDNPDGAT